MSRIIFAMFRLLIVTFVLGVKITP